MMLVPEIPGFTDAFPSFVWDHGILNHIDDNNPGWGLKRLVTWGAFCESPCFLLIAKNREDLQNIIRIYQSKVHEVIGTVPCQPKLAIQPGIMGGAIAHGKGRNEHHLQSLDSISPPKSHGNLEFPRISLLNHSWLVVWNMNFIFPYIGNNHPN